MGGRVIEPAQTRSRGREESPASRLGPGPSRRRLTTPRREISEWHDPKRRCSLVLSESGLPRAGALGEAGLPLPSFARLAQMAARPRGGDGPWLSRSGAAPESNRASVGLPRLTGLADSACLPHRTASVRCARRSVAARCRRWHRSGGCFRLPGREAVVVLLERHGGGAWNPAVDGEEVAVVGGEVAACGLHRLWFYHRRDELVVAMGVGDQGVPFGVDVEFHRP